jgi:hypothetical protein
MPDRSRPILALLEGLLSPPHTNLILFLVPQILVFVKDKTPTSTSHLHLQPTNSLTLRAHSPTPNKPTLSKTSPSVKRNSPKGINVTAGSKSPSGKATKGHVLTSSEEGTTLGKNQNTTKGKKKTNSKKKPSVTSPKAKPRPEANTSPASKKTVTSSYSQKAKTNKSSSGEFYTPREENTIGSDNNSRYSFQSKGDRPYKDLPTHPLENEAVEKHYALLTLSIFKSLFKKECDCEKPNLQFFKVKHRPTVARCSSCHKQVSITSNTPLHKFQLPLGYFSYILHDAILQYPKVITSTEISRKLNLPYKTAYFLKRRLQVVTSMLNTKLRENLK